MKNYTTVHAHFGDRTEVSRTYYAQVSDPRYLPDAARCDETIAEWEAWHKAHKTPEYARYMTRRLSNG